MKLKNFFIRIMPDHESIKSTKNIGFLKAILQDPDIFHLTRRSASGGIATGFFIAFLPIPGHTILAILFSVLLRINLPLTLLFSWTTNPFTMAPIFYIAYKIGAVLLGVSIQPVNFQFNQSWFTSVFSEIWAPLLTGCLLLSIVSSISSYILIRVLWRHSVVSRWNNRKLSRKS